MIDKDGIERPDDFHEHTHQMPHYKNKKLKLKYKISFNPFVRFFAYCFRILIYLILLTFFKFKYRFKVRGRENLKKVKKQSAVVVGNHCHFLDVAFYAVMFMPRMVFITSIQENFLIPIAGTLVKMLGGIPIPTDLKGSRQFKNTINEALERKKAVMFLPEASLWPFYRDLRPFKKGAFNFAVRQNSAILPVVTCLQIVHKSPTKKKYRVTQKFLPPVHPDLSLSESEAIEKLMNEAYKSMRAAILEGAANDIYTKKYLRQKKLAEKQL